MNRRQFFGMTATAVALAGLPALVLPEKKIFLPPLKGWFQSPYIREVEQYLINNDSVSMRWDVAWMTRAGEYEQHYILEEPLSGLQAIQMGPQEVSLSRNMLREQATRLLEAKVPFGAKVVKLKLPAGIQHARYV